MEKIWEVTGYSLLTIFLSIIITFIAVVCVENSGYGICHEELISERISECKHKDAKIYITGNRTFCLCPNNLKSRFLK